MPTPPYRSELQLTIDGVLATADKACADIKAFTRVTQLAIVGTMLAALVGISLSHERRPSQALIIIVITVPQTLPDGK